MSSALQNARSLYERGIRDGSLDEVLSTYMGDTYTQHSTGVPDGKSGFRHFFHDFFRRNPRRDIRVVRAFQDGPYVFMHVFQSLNDGAARWVTTDIFRAAKDGRIVEHWDVIEEYRSPAPGTPDQVLGTFAPDAAADAEKNKATVRTLLVQVMQNHDLEVLGAYVADDVLQHDPALGQGVDAWREWLRAHDVTYDFVFKVVGSGDYVATYSQVLLDGMPYAYFDLFRLQDGRVVEHWTNKEVVPPREELTNSGKF